MRLALIPFLLLSVPVIEIAVFVVVGGEIGVGLTLLFVLLTAILGSVLLRIQGLAVVERIRREINADRLPGRDLGDGAMILVAGILLLTPGFVTDSLGFLLFVPAIRNGIWQFVASRFVVLAGRSGSGADPSGDPVVDLDPEEFSETPNPDSPWRDEDDR